MSIDWNVVATIVSPLIALLFGVWVNRRFENRANLIAHYGHIAAFVSKTDTGVPFNVHTHAVVLRNTGRKSATNVRLHHRHLPDFTIYPSIVFHEEKLPDGSKDIVIPSLIPGKQITISYLYFPPDTVSEINSGIDCDQGFAKVIPVLLQRQYPKFVNVIVAVLMFCGLVSIIYLTYLLVKLLIGVA